MSEHPPFPSRFRTQIHRLTVAGRAIELVAPENPDVLLDDPEVARRYKADNYMPYWPIVWPSGLMLAERILGDAGAPPAIIETGGAAARCIELGCGLGLAGIAAGLRGWDVTLTDYDAEAVVFARYNALRNGVAPQRVRALAMDWRLPLAEQFAWVMASDVLYERRLHPLVLHAVGKLLAPGGVAWIGDPLRSSAEDFPLAAVQEGFRVETFNMELPAMIGTRKDPGQCYVLRRARERGGEKG